MPGQVSQVPRALTALGVAGFAVLTGVAVWGYHGGNGVDREAPGYAWRYNYWCDLYRAHALDGADQHVGAQLAQVGALCSVVAIFFGFWCASAGWGARGRSRLQALTRALAAVACAAMVAVPLMPADRFGRLHFIVVGLAAGPALLAFTLAAAALTHADRWLRVLTALAYGASVLHFGHYLLELTLGHAWGAGIAAEQKLVTLLDFAWLLAVALTTRRPAPGASPC